MQRVAVIGAGNMGRRHANAYAQIPEAEIVAVFDLHAEAAEELAGIYSASAFTDFEELLANVETDVIDICTPTPSHLEYITAAAEAGKHICSEKPLARTTAEAQEAVRVCKEAGVTLFVAQVLRWFPEFRKLHDLIKSGAVGEPVEVRTSRCGAPPSGTDDWFADYKRSGGVALDLIIHDYDWLRWCFGKVCRVYARGLYEMKDFNGDYALVTLRFESGAIAHIEGSWARLSGFETSVEVAGTEGLLSFSNVDSRPLVVEMKAKDGSTNSVVIAESPIATNPYYLELKHFIDCLETGKAPDVSPEDGLEAVRIGEAALRSISAGQPVLLA